MSIAFCIKNKIAFFCFLLFNDQACDSLDNKNLKLVLNGYFNCEVLAVYLLYPLSLNIAITSVYEHRLAKNHFINYAFSFIHIENLLLVLVWDKLINTSFQGIFFSFTIWLCLHHIYSEKAVNNITSKIKT